MSFVLRYDLSGGCTQMDEVAPEVILDETILLHPEDSKTNVCIPFLLKKDYSSLEFFCSYEPKNCDETERAKQLILEGFKAYVPPESAAKAGLFRKTGQTGASEILTGISTGAFENQHSPAYPDQQYWSEYFGPLESFLPSVVSLITLSVDSPEGYLGCAHRHTPVQRIIISADYSSPGFFRHSPRGGNWRAVINAHSVVNSEVNYRLKITARNGSG